jgi:hypothetical protein
MGPIGYVKKKAKIIAMFSMIEYESYQLGTV